MDKKIKKSESIINKLYDNLTYFDVYGGSVFFCFILIIIPIIVCAYFYVMKNAYPIKNDWTAQRCNPIYIPFAGFINKPDDKTIFEYTEENMAFCVQNVLTSVTAYLIEPITFVTSSLTSLFNELVNLFQELRMIISNVRTYVADIAKEILGRIANIMIPLQEILIKFKDSMGKMKGILVTGLYTSMGAFLAFKSFLGTIVQVIILVLIMFVGVVIGLWILGFFYFPAAAIAAIMTTLMILLLILIVPVIDFMKSHLDINVKNPLPSVPSKPSCFDKNTLLKMSDSSFKKILDIEVGDILFNNNRVTAKMKLDARNIDMFEINGIIVSGCHRIYDKEKWIYVKDYREKKQVKNYVEPFIFCLNTESKRIHVDSLEFCDWDEVFEKEAGELLDLINKDKSETEYIHKRFDNGFINTTQIEMNDGSVKEIQYVCVNDILRGNIKVYGTVEIYAEDLNNITLGERDKIGKTEIYKKRDHLVKIFHLLTDNDYFTIENKKYFDYNSCIETFLESFTEKYFI